jgi:hypothetical protein
VDGGLRGVGVSQHCKALSENTSARSKKKTALIITKTVPYYLTRKLAVQWLLFRSSVGLRNKSVVRADAISGRAVTRGPLGSQSQVVSAVEHVINR